MTVPEFKVWINGFCEGIESAPNKFQWNKILEEIVKLDDVEETEITKEPITQKQPIFYAPAPMPLPQPFPIPTHLLPPVPCKESEE